MSGAKRERTFYVYVVELSQDGLDRPNPTGRVYVGETELTPEQRFEKHKAGGRTANWQVKNYGVKLRYDLFPPGNPYPTREAAEAEEKATVARLRAAGYTTVGGKIGMSEFWKLKKKREFAKKKREQLNKFPWNREET